MPTTRSPDARWRNSWTISRSTTGSRRRSGATTGKEFISRALKEWASESGVAIVHIQPGKPMQNGYVERFNGTYRRAVLDAVLFRNLEEVRKVTDEWREDYNRSRPHEALGDMTPEEFYRNGLKAAGLRGESKGKAARPPPSSIPHGRKVAGKAEALKMN